MFKYLYEYHLSTTLLGKEQATLADIKYPLNIENNSLAEQIYKIYPIKNFGDPKSLMNIFGSKAFIEKYYNIDDKKCDITCTYDNLKYLHLNDETKNIIFKFTFPDSNEELFAESIYHFESDFLSNFNAKKYIDYCKKNQYTNLIETNISSLLNLEKETKKQFRLLKNDKDTWFIRSCTSNRYNNYDNSIVIYLTFLAINKYALEKNINFIITNSFISDSYLHINLEHSESIKLKDIGFLHLGIEIINGEIRNRTIQTNLRYTFSDKNNNTIFSACFHQPIFKIIHTTRIENINQSLSQLSHLNLLEEKLEDFIAEILKVEKLTEDKTHFIFNKLLEKIKSNENLSQKTKSKFKTEEFKQLVSNTMSLLQFMNKVQSVETDIDEKSFIERIINDVINDLIENSRY